MRFSKDHEEALFVVFKILVRQLGLPEKCRLFLDKDEWVALYPIDCHRNFDELHGLSHPTGDVFIAVDNHKNFYDLVVSMSHELFHIRRPRINSEFYIEQWATQWLNNPLYAHVDLSKL